MKVKQLLFSLLALSSVHQMIPMENASDTPAAISITLSLAACKDSSQKDPRRQLFFDAASAGNLPQVQELLNEGIPVDTKGSDCTALFLAASNGHEEVCKLLIQHGANTNCGFRGAPIWQVAAYNGHTAAFKFLLDDHKLKQSKEGYSKSIITFLCCLKQKKETKSDTLATTLYNQAQTLLQPYCIFNLRRCTDGINQKDSHGITILMDVARSGCIDLCQQLIQHGADVNIQSTRLHTLKPYTALSLTRDQKTYNRARLKDCPSTRKSLARYDNVCNLLLANGAIEIEGAEILDEVD